MPTRKTARPENPGTAWGRICVTIGLGLVLVFATAMPTLGKNNGFRQKNADRTCTETSKAAFKACQFEVQDDYWIALGICSNLIDSEERGECLADARESQADGREECGEQLVARLEVCDAIGEAPYDPEVNPENFVNPMQIGSSVDPNPYFPLVPGSEWLYEGDGETITVTVLAETKEILGVTCIVVRDVVEEDGEIVEDTDDWYAQDLEGNVWYFGEISLNYEEGELVDIEGSWKAGRDGDKPGILMKRFPEVGDIYRQEFSLGNAEDMAEVESLMGSAETPAATCENDCLVTGEFTPIEPGGFENKYYAPGIGLILEVNPETGDRVELVSFGVN